MKILKTLALVLLAAVLLLLAYAATRPDSFRVQRSLRIAAPAEKLFPMISDLKQFNLWNPYLRKDPGSQQTYGNVTAGPGALYGWASEKLGEGSMQVVDVTAPTRVSMKLDFIKPYEGHNMAEFSLTPEGDGTTVVWAMHGPANYVSKLMGVVFNMDRMIGTDFEDGLVNLKTLAESR